MLTYAPSGSKPSKSVSTETPSHAVPSFDHDVTQWMSTVMLSCGSACSSSQLQRRGGAAEAATEGGHGRGSEHTPAACRGTPRGMEEVAIAAGELEAAFVPGAGMVG